MKQNHLRTRRERGQSIILVALMALVLVAFAGLALDGAQAYDMRRRMQNAADAGALAGARELFMNSSYQIINGKVASYTVGGNNLGNGAGSYEGTFLPSGNNVKTTAPAASDNCVQVSTQVVFTTYMIGLIGFDNLDAGALAKACYGSILSSNASLWPMLIHTPTTPFAFNQVITIFNDGTTSGSAFGWADFNGGNNKTSETENWLNNSYSGTWHISDYSGGTCPGLNQRDVPMLSIGDCLDGDPGLAVSKKVKDAIDAHIGVSVTVLLYDNAGTKADGTGNNARYHVMGFSRFTVLGYDLTGSTKYVSGKFQKYVLPGEICANNCGSSVSIKGISLAP